MSRRHAIIDFRSDGSYIVQAYSMTTDWRWLGIAEPKRLDSPVSDDELVHAVRFALGQSRSGIERPEKLDRLMDPVLAVANVRSQRAYYDGTRSIGITEEDSGHIEVEPSHRDKREFIPKLDQVISLDIPTTQELAKAIRNAIETSD
jgi:hypothetical protein